MELPRNPPILKPNLRFNLDHPPLNLNVGDSALLSLNKTFLVTAEQPSSRSPLRTCTLAAR